MKISADGTIRLKIVFLGLIFFGVICALLWRFYQVQVKNHDYYQNKAKKKFISEEHIYHKRGEIFDYNGVLLVANVPAVAISCAPCNLKNDDARRELARLWSETFGIVYEEAYKKLAPTLNRVVDGKEESRPNRYVMICRFATLEQADIFKKSASQKKLGSALYYANVSARAYPRDSALANVVGYVDIQNDDIIPRMGLEKQLNDVLAHVDGSRQYIRRKDGLPIESNPTQKFLEKPEVGHDGKNVYLTIVDQIQSILEKHLDEAWVTYAPVTIYAAIADPKTGNILALAQRPNFDPGDRATFKAEAIGSRIATDMFEPGSIAKALTISCALDNGVITPNTVINCEKNKVWFYRGRPITDTGCYGMQNIAGVLKHSSNIGTAKIAVERMGDKMLYEGFRNFGIGTKTNLPIAGESSGLFRNYKRWDGLTGSRVAYGYSVSMTALQILRAYCALANGGILPELRLIDRIENPTTKKVIIKHAAPGKQVFKHPETARIVSDMLVSVTEKDGTAPLAAIPGFKVAGKTGTAHKVVGKAYTRKYRASFAGYVPAQDPRLVMVVVVDEPTKVSHYGGKVSAPIFRETMKEVLNYLDVAPTEPIPEKNK